MFAQRMLQFVRRALRQAHFYSPQTAPARTAEG
jgi:hypothetical protein